MTVTGANCILAPSQSRVIRACIHPFTFLHVADTTTQGATCSLGGITNHTQVHKHTKMQHWELFWVSVTCSRTPLTYKLQVHIRWTPELHTPPIGGDWVTPSHQLHQMKSPEPLKGLVSLRRTGSQAQPCRLNSKVNVCITKPINKQALS